MRKLNYFIAFFILVCAVSARASQTDTLFTLAHAEKIIGEKAHMTETKTTNEAKSIMYRSAYIANQKDAATGKTGNIYYLMEWYKQEADAHAEYMHIKTMNEKNGITTLTGIGDEAYFHTDNTKNFLYIQVRKGTKMFRMKVNKTTSHTNEKAFNDIAKELAKQL